MCLQMLYFLILKYFFEISDINVKYKTRSIVFLGNS